MVDQKRYDLIDVIRGFALFGILLVNMRSFHSPEFLETIYNISHKRSGADYGIYIFFQLFIQMKFYPIFSFLFGLGFYLFMSKTGKLFYFMLRSLFLFIVGFIHLIFIWYGDILHLYAITSFFLLFFYKLPSKQIARWGISLLTGYHVFLAWSIPNTPSSLITFNEIKYLMSNYISMYREASYIQWVHYRLHIEVVPILFQLPFVIIPVLGWFLLGLYVGKEKMFIRTINNIKRISVLWRFILSSSIILVFLHSLALFEIIDRDLSYLLSNLSGVTLAILYMTTIYLYIEEPLVKKVFYPFKYIGKMSMTNYLAQSIILTLFIRYFHLYNRISLAEGLLMSICFFLIQFAISYLWLSRYNHGPIEWIWRLFIYRKILPLRKGKDPIYTIYKNGK